MMLDWHDPWCQQLELLLDLEPVAACGHLDAVMEHCAERVALQSPAAACQVTHACEMLLPLMIPFVVWHAVACKPTCRTYHTLGLSSAGDC